MKTLIEQVGIASQDEARGIDQIAAGVKQMEQVTQSAAASAEENASATEEVRSQSKSLDEIVNDLKVLDRLVRDLFQCQFPGLRTEQSDGQHHHQHAGCNERENSAYSEAAQEKCDHERAEYHR